MNSQALQKNLSEIQAELDKEINSGDIQAVQDKLIKLSSLSGLSAECIKYAKGNALYGQRDIIEKKKGQGLNPSILKMKIEGELWEELSTLAYAERINAAITHAADALRTIISLYKEEMNQSKFQQG